MRRIINIWACLLLVPLIALGKAAAKEAVITSHKDGQILSAGHVSVDGKFGTPHGEVKAVDITQPSHPQVIKDRVDVPSLNISFEMTPGQVVKVSARNIPGGAWTSVTLRGAVPPNVSLPGEVTVD